MPHILPRDLDLHSVGAPLFPGFGERAFEILRTLWEVPTVAQYRALRTPFDRAIRAPFHLYRDEVALRLVLPNELPLETERNVFSRIPKNDFGQGGAHHHYWMAFYRRGMSRLKDVQLSHGIHPDRFVVGLYVGAQAGRLFIDIRERLVSHADVSEQMINTVLENGFALEVGRGTTRSAGTSRYSTVLDHLPGEIAKARGIWISKSFTREDVLKLGPRLVDQALEAVVQLWPLYVFCTQPSHLD